MKTIGVIGGMSWESTTTYYQLLNRGVKAALGGLHSAKIVLVSVDFAEIERLQHQGDWERTAAILATAARQLELAGADFFIIATNTMHKVAPDVEKAVAIPLLHIADATAEMLQHDGIQKVGLLGTRFTMEQDFYKGKLQSDFRIEVLVPDEVARAAVHEVIYQELCLGVIQDSSRQRYLEVVSSLHARGAEAVMLGCTEIALLIQQEHTKIPLYDTTEIHAKAAVQYAISAV